jgi:citrate lyase beta subunit
MNQCEQSMLDILKKLREEFGAVSVKAEFEAEGTRTDELLRLIDLARRADLKVGLKIGGCEAVRDLLESQQFGVEYIIAPMVETPYALKKFIEAKNKVYSQEQQKYTDFLFNVETITAFNSLNHMVTDAKKPDGVEGVVFGRVDFAGSMDKSRSIIDSDEMTDYICKTAEICKANKLDLVVGGAIGSPSIPHLKRVADIHLTRYETRKVIFDGTSLKHPQIIKGLEQTVHFELLWLQNKRDYYHAIKHEDSARIAMLEKRWNEIQAH